MGREKHWLEKNYSYRTKRKQVAERFLASVGRDVLTGNGKRMIFPVSKQLPECNQNSPNSRPFSTWLNSCSRRALMMWSISAFQCPRLPLGHLKGRVPSHRRVVSFWPLSPWFCWLMPWAVSWTSESCQGGTRHSGLCHWVTILTRLPWRLSGRMGAFSMNLLG